MSRPVRVLVIDDSALVREALSRGLSRDPLIEVVATAQDAYVARDRIVQLRPDVLTLDVEMPRMTGVDFLRKLMPQYPLPVVMVSALTERGARVTLEALEAGAVDFVAKPSSNLAQGLPEMLVELRTKIKIAATVDVSRWRRDGTEVPGAVATRRVATLPTPPTLAVPPAPGRVIAIGASTGGTEALRAVLMPLPAHCPGIVVVQHMPPNFTGILARRLDEICTVRVKEAETGDPIQPGHVLIAPGDRHIRVVRGEEGYLVECTSDDLVCGHRPSADVLFQSVARVVGDKAIGVLLTGMGRDGAEGMVQMRSAGARTLAQDEATCVVFGMPRVAYERGGAERLVPLPEMAAAVVSLLSGTTASVR